MTCKDCKPHEHDDTCTTLSASGWEMCSKWRDIELCRLHAQAPELVAAVTKILEGFDEDVFIRNIAHDGNHGWAIRLMPYIVALGTAKAILAAVEAK